MAGKLIPDISTTISATAADGTLTVTSTTGFLAGARGYLYNQTVPANWAALTAYTPGNIVTNGGKQYVCTTGGTSAASGGPTGTGTGIADDTVVWDFLGSGVFSGPAGVSIIVVKVVDSTHLVVRLDRDPRGGGVGTDRTQIQADNNLTAYNASAYSGGKIHLPAQFIYNPSEAPL